MRKLLFNIHLCRALVSGVLALILGLTGSGRSRVTVDPYTGPA